MPTLAGIKIREVYEVTCPDHGGIDVVQSGNAARIRQRQHFEWRHQPDPTDRLCHWRYPVGGARPGYELCVLPAAHDYMHECEDGSTFGEYASLPREGIDYC